MNRRGESRNVLRDEKPALKPTRWVHFGHVLFWKAKRNLGTSVLGGRDAREKLAWETC